MTLHCVHCGTLTCAGKARAVCAHGEMTPIEGNGNSATATLTITGFTVK